MDEATQPSTQPYTDPRRRGLNNSGLDQQDVTDIICILHPSSMPAHATVSTTLKHNPQHILQREDFEYDDMDTISCESNPDIALRLSSNVKDRNNGFCFGRSVARCDIIFFPNDRFSNVHFRIYLKSDGILMLKDTSTNGTVVDNKLIRKDRKNNSPTTQMLMPGSIIQVAGSEPSSWIKFVVRIPCRDEFQAQFNRNLAQYLHRIRELNTKAEEIHRDESDIIIPESNHPHGMHWNGGLHYNVTGQIGKGAFATVYKLATKDDGALYACKELDKRRLMKNNILDHKVDGEMRIMKGLEHPNIVRFHDYFDHNNRWIYIIMEYVGGGELSTHLNRTGHLQENLVRSIARQILHALQYLHAKKITHRDIKPDNILISSFEPFRVKLSDFGLSKVVQEETFLKTFCGTLLYCAPEVYPEYENYRHQIPRKRRRPGDPLPKTSPYDHSVDMWSFGAVLFHILCGSPPYMGRGDDRGSQMLRNIMTTDADYTALRNVHVSEDGIDFISKLLNRDPKARPKKLECFQHPWLVDVPDEYDYMDLGEAAADPVPTGLVPVVELDEDEELDASVLELNDHLKEVHEHDGDESDLWSSIEPVQVKKPRVTEEQDADQQIVQAPAEIRYPSLPHISSYGFGSNIQQEVTPTAPRLFGEISGRALESSGVLGENYRTPANLPEFEHEYQDDSFLNHLSSNDNPSTSSLSPYATAQTRASPSRLGFGVSDSSLMGAESLVGHLRMESLVPTAPNSDNHTPPETYKGNGGNNGQISLKGSLNEHRQVDGATDATLTPQTEEGSQPAENRRSFSQNAFDDQSINEVNKNKDNELLHHYAEEQGNAGEVSKNDCHNRIVEEELACTIDERTGEEIGSSIGYEPVHSSRNIQPYSQETTTKTTLHKNVDRFMKPATILGKLTPLPGSITDLPIRLESRMTSWGRGTHATIRHPDPMDHRIPSYALELTFWASSIESRIAAGEDWMQMEDVVTTISTKTSRCIWVNDVELRKENREKDAFLFGKVYTGDIVTVYRNGKQFLRFRCEFYHGKSKHTRPADEGKFVIQKSSKSTSPVVGDAQSRTATSMHTGAGSANTIAGSETTVSTNHANVVSSRVTVS